MLASTKQISVAIAVTLGVALSTPLSPAFSAAAPSNTARTRPLLRFGMAILFGYVQEDH